MSGLQTALLTLMLSSAGDTVLLDFYSDSCMPCRQMDPTVRQLAAMGYPVRKVNCAREPELAGRFGVTQIPCFVMLVGGREVDRVIGLTPLPRLEQMCKLAAGRPSSKEPAAAIASGSAAPPRVIPAVQSGLDLSALSGSTPPPGPNTADLIAATVRLRIEDSTGHSCGSGTIIDARDGEALILTCGHIFRDSKGKGRIEVDLFGPTPARGIAGQILFYDLESDIGLLTIRTPGPVTAARVAPPGYRIAKGDAVINLGCNNGDQPTARRSHVTALDRFIGPPNLEVAGLPVQGRSGGGLFSADGSVIGVCNAADPTDNEGLYAALGAVQGVLERAKLSYIYRSGDKGTSASGASGAALAAADPPPMAKQMPRSEDAAPLTEVASRSSVTPPPASQADPRQPLSDRERAALEEIDRRRLEGAEVICVIRPRSNPQGQSEIIVLDKVSPAFLEHLTAEPRPQDRRLTSLEIPRRPEGVLGSASAASSPARPKILLEYTAPPPAATASAGSAAW